ncbi:hypothetical protein D6779_11345 [Candidatus Parcubacteria bacterium]|nr:MAG: hypothetical protein D6779_11345 [Candidatus Parcubacteria bacterium]
MISLEIMLEEHPNELREILSDNDVAVEVVKMVATKPRNQWAFELEQILQLSESHAEDFLRDMEDCPWCGGSGGGYMGRAEPMCRHCRGTGRRHDCRA